MNLPDIESTSVRWPIVVRFVATFIGGIISILFLATGVLDVSETYLPSAIAKYINPRSALVLIAGSWGVLWTIYLGPVEEGEPSNTSWRRDVFMTFGLFLLLFIITSGWYSEMETRIEEVPGQIERVALVDRLSPWLILPILVYSAYYGAKQDYLKQKHDQSGEKDL